MKNSLKHQGYTPGSMERPDANVTHPASTAPMNAGIGGQQSPSGRNADTTGVMKKSGKSDKSDMGY